MSVVRKATAAAAGSLLMLGAMAAPSQAAPTIQDGLVNVKVGNVYLLNGNDINVNVVAEVVATVCDVNVDVTALATLVDATGHKETVCRAEGGKVTIVNNN